MKILVVLPRFPYPLEKGDKLRAFNQIKILSENNDVYLFCVTHDVVTAEHRNALRPYCKELCIVSSPRLTNYYNVFRNYVYAKSLQIGYWDSKRARRRFKQFESRVNPDVIYSQMVRTMTYVSRSHHPKVMDFQDALSMNAERRMDHASGLWKYILHYEFKMLRSSEYNSFRIFDALTIISDTDSEAIPHRKNGEIHIIPNGVDFEYFFPIEREKRYDVLFCGNMSYEPNIRATNFLMQNVMPLVWQQRPETTVLIAGASPRRGLSRYVSEKVTLMANVPDIRECYASSRVLVAPMQTGSGLQNKLLEAMSMRIPCVTTTIANDSLHAIPDQDILIGDTPQELADKILVLLSDANKYQSIEQSAYDFVHANYSWEASVGKLESILRHSVDHSPQVR
ncbi:MAG: glycosyltransferase [Bacteroidales bacterium]|nr:glycosyltransferase [Bacteroidales bacterium]